MHKKHEIKHKESELFFQEIKKNDNLVIWNYILYKIITNEALSVVDL
ncbi:MAG: hypothetical protein HYS16_01325 [Deltaproteobacteria bacterium]|nr:MAG: hypothetical protein HYS16_01325 [Deltaproteobacteria bacterium]